MPLYLLKCLLFRFGPPELYPNPGVGEYNIDPTPDENNQYRSSLLRQSASLSSKGFGNSFLSKTVYPYSYSTTRTITKQLKCKFKSMTFEFFDVIN